MMIINGFGAISNHLAHVSHAAGQICGQGVSSMIRAVPWILGSTVLIDKSPQSFHHYFPLYIQCMILNGYEED
jgi:hypothetical protein